MEKPCEFPAEILVVGVVDPSLPPYSASRATLSERLSQVLIKAHPCWNFALKGFRVSPPEESRCLIFYRPRHSASQKKNCSDTIARASLGTNVHPFSYNSNSLGTVRERPGCHRFSQCLVKRRREGAVGGEYRSLSSHFGTFLSDPELTFLS